VPEQELVQHYSRALFVPFVPYDEDYGLITLEAMASGKPVLTSTDSGGVHELVIHEENGLVVQPEPKSLARAMQELISRPDRTREMGEKARESVSGITWQNTVNALLERKEPWATVIAPRRKKVVVASTFQVSPGDSGGKQRIFHLCRELARHADVSIVCLGSGQATGRPVQLAPGLTEISIPRSKEQRELDRDLKKKLGGSVQDIAAIHGFDTTLPFVEELGRECRDADLALLAHPFLFYALRRVYPGPFWYDAHNVEFDMKDAVLPPSRDKAHYLEQVYKVEAAACARAQAVLSVSEADAARLEGLYPVDQERIIHVPNGMDFSYAQEYRLSADERAGLKKRMGLESAQAALFMGSSHQPNNQAARAILDMAPDCPETLFLVAGSVCRVLEQESLPANVQALGVLDEAEKRVALSASDVGLNPVVTGSGSNLKVLEYIAYGLPVLSTPFGLRGHDLVPDLEVLQAEVQDFSNMLRNIYEQDPDVMREMAFRALERSRRDYDWSRTIAPAVRLLHETFSS
ncbi:MAG: glycosyltransferase family 4 protein, partial [Desulfovermiculus sp.]